MGKIRGEGKIYKETRKKTVTDKKTGETREEEYVLWCFRVELDPKPNGDRDYTVIRRKNRNDLVKAKRELLKKIEDGEPLKKDKTTVEAWLAYWLDEIAKPRMRPRPWRNHKSTIKVHIVPHLGKVKLADLEPRHIRYMLTEIVKSGRSARTAEIAYNLLHKALDDAKKEPGLALRHNVVELVAKPKVASNTQDASAPRALTDGQQNKKLNAQKPRKALTSQQARAVIAAALEQRDPLAVRWASALLLGVRQGECLGLTTDAINLEEGTADLSWALQAVPLKREPGKKLPSGDTYPLDMYDITPDFEIRPLYKAMCLVRPKTASSTRLTPIPAPLLALLRTHIATMAPNPWGLLWVAPAGQKEVKPGTPIRGRLDDRLWADALARAGAPDVVLHAARHTTATLLLEAGVPEDVRMAIMGHSSAAAQRLYAHADIGVKRAGLSALDDLIDAEVVGVEDEFEPLLSLVAAPAVIAGDDAAADDSECAETEEGAHRELPQAASGPQGGGGWGPVFLAASR
ncbi:tyrosine-type recombinase/integrase [Nocardia niigatensis]